MKSVLKVLGTFLLAFAISFVLKFSTPQEALGFSGGNLVTCYSTFRNVNVGGKSTIDCADCKRINNTKDREDRGSCDPCGCAQN